MFILIYQSPYKLERTTCFPNQGVVKLQLKWGGGKEKDIRRIVKQVNKDIKTM